MDNIEKLESKYIELLLKKCINFKKSKSLFISYNKLNKNFVENLVKEAESLGATDIYLEEEDLNYKHDLLKDIRLDEIKEHPCFNKSKWDEYALKDASFLILETEIPELMSDISPDKLAKAKLVERATRPIYKKKQLSFQIPWCISALPSQKWADKVFPGDSNSLEKLFLAICDACMVNTKNPIESWNNHLIENKGYVEKLNNLNIKSLHYKNSLGTDFYIELPCDAIWCGASDLGDDMIVNMPTFEIFTSPDKNTGKGIVYSSRPLVYNGVLIDKFYMEFEKGKIINYGAEIGLDMLKEIIESDEYSCFLGEVALVSYDSPISKTGKLFYQTLFDENASCHLALGNGFTECIKDGEKYSDSELLDLGINVSKTHVDYMIGTSDLEINVTTKNGKRLVLFKNGNFNI